MLVILGHLKRDNFFSFIWRPFLIDSLGCQRGEQREERSTLLTFHFGEQEGKSAFLEMQYIPFQL